MFGDLPKVIRVVAAVENAAVHCRMERLDPSLQDLGETRQFRDRSSPNPTLNQRAQRAAGRKDFNAMLLETTSERDYTSFV
jgi:hypothetical protein